MWSSAMGARPVRSSSPRCTVRLTTGPVLPQSMLCIHPCLGCTICIALQGTAKQTLLVTDSDLKKLGSITKPNPQHKDWAPMRLYLLSQVG